MRGVGWLFGCRCLALSSFLAIHSFTPRGSAAASSILMCPSHSQRADTKQKRAFPFLHSNSNVPSHKILDHSRPKAQGRAQFPSHRSYIGAITRSPHFYIPPPIFPRAQYIYVFPVGLWLKAAVDRLLSFLDWGLFPFDIKEYISQSSNKFLPIQSPVTSL